MIDGSMKKEYRRPDNQESQRQHDTQLQKKTSMYNNARHKDKQANTLHINKREQLAQTYKQAASNCKPRHDCGHTRARENLAARSGARRAGGRTRSGALYLLADERTSRFK